MESVVHRGFSSCAVGGLVIFFSLTTIVMSSPAYPWLEDSTSTERTLLDISPPPNTVRVAEDSTSFATWLRQLPLLPERTPVALYNGERKENQSAHYAVLAIDIGRRDLQQCADAAIRLRAEYLFSQHDFDRIAFRFTSGDTAAWISWSEGTRPVVRGNQVDWQQNARPDSSYRSFREYLDTVFMYAGTISLNRDLKRKTDLCAAEPGDILLRGGSPGHAVIVIDVARDTLTDTRYLLLAQSFMPAQHIHILKNPNDQSISPWYPCECDQTLVTPEWTFHCSDLRSF